MQYVSNIFKYYVAYKLLQEQQEADARTAEASAGYADDRFSAEVFAKHRRADNDQASEQAFPKRGIQIVFRFYFSNDKVKKPCTKGQ